ncbi:MAG: hypothetical protein ABSA65_05660 [Acidimicrobiales bacterium]
MTGPDLQGAPGDPRRAWKIAQVAVLPASGRTSGGTCHVPDLDGGVTAACTP